MNNKELVKEHQEYVKTAFGVRAFIFTTIPLLFAAYSFYMFVYYFNNENELLPVLYFTCAVIASVGFCITQMQYGKLLNDHIKSKK